MSVSERYAAKTQRVLAALARSLKHYKKPSVSDEDALKLQVKDVRDKIENLPNVVKFLDKHIGKNVGVKPVSLGRGGALRLLAQYLGGKLSLSEMSQKALVLFKGNYEARSLHRAQSPLIETIPEELRAFLPPKIVVNLDDDGRITKITDMFDNVSYGLSEKISAQQELIRDYQRIEKKIHQGLKSDDVVTRDLCLILAIIMETGIRPGNRSNGIKDIIDGKEIKKETFGAVTLKSEHIRVHGAKAYLEFNGKKGTLNKATILDKRTIKALKEVLVERSGYLFPDLDYEDLSAYFSKNFKGFKITDFRKLRATKEVFDGLKEERNSLFQRIKAFASLEAREQEQRVIGEIKKTLAKVHNNAQIALSHESSKTTEKSYINPQVLLAFLSSGGMLNTFEEAILDGRTKLVFDISKFIQNAKRVASLNAPIISFKTQQRSLSDIIFDVYSLL